MHARRLRCQVVYSGIIVRPRRHVQPARQQAIRGLLYAVSLLRLDVGSTA